MKTNVTWSTDEDAFIAGKQCGKKAVLDLNQTKIAILFSSVKYDTKQLLKGSKEILGTAPIIGCTSRRGIITQDGYITSANGFAGMMAIGDENTTVVTAGSEKHDDARITGRNVAINALKKIGAQWFPNYFMMIASPGEEEEYLKGIQDVIGDVPCFGGTASDEDLSGKWRIYTEDVIIENGVAVAFFYTDKKIKTKLEHGYHETVNSGVITNVIGKREISEINNIQALKKYAEWTDKRVRDLSGMRLLLQSVLMPLGVKNYNGNVNIIKQPLNGNTNFGINVANDIAVNMSVIQMQIEKHELIDFPTTSLRKKKNTENDVAYLVLNNQYREMIIDNDIEKMASKLNKEIKEKPYLMAFTNGEYGREEHTSNMCTSLSMVSTIFTNQKSINIDK